MSGTYQISVEPHRHLLRIRFAGFFCVEDLSGYSAAKSQALARLCCNANSHLTLCDFSDCVPQSKDVLALFSSSLADPKTRSRRLAVVVNRALSQMQVARIVTRPDAACFKTVDAAEQWLFDDAIGVSLRTS